MSLDDICREAASQTALALGKSLREGVDDGARGAGEAGMLRRAVAAAGAGEVRCRPLICSVPSPVDRRA